jgi:hypothetical protein
MKLSPGDGFAPQQLLSNGDGLILIYLSFLLSCEDFFSVNKMFPVCDESIFKAEIKAYKQICKKCPKL